MGERTVITGLGILSPNGVGKAEFREAIRAGRSGVRRIGHLDASTFETKIAGFIDDDKIDALWQDKKAKSRLDRITLFSLIAADMAWTDSRLDEVADEPYRKGIVVGTGCGTTQTAEYSYERFFLLKIPHVKPSTVPRGMYNAAAGEIGIKYGLRKISNTVTTACSSALVALALADQYIRAGLADIMLVGGVDCPLLQVYYRIWDSLRVMTRDFNDQPERASRPFTVNRSGMVLSEGCAFVALERESVAAKRNAPIYAEVLGIGQTNDAFHIVAPRMESQAECMEEAMANAGVAKADLNHIQAHGTSTELNDVAETKGIKEVFGPKAYEIPVSSIKSMIGHTLGASGLISLIGVLLGMQDGFVAPTINYDAPDPDCDLDYVPNQAREQAVRTAMVNAFGFGGTNVSVVVRKP